MVEADSGHRQKSNPRYLDREFDATKSPRLEETLYSAYTVRVAIKLKQNWYNET